MNSKEVQLSLSFCGALAAMLLISAPVNETISLAGSCIAFIISSGFFYGGISKYFADKEKQSLHAEKQAELTIEIVKAIKNLNDNLSDSIQKPIAELQNSTNAQLKDVIEAMESLDDTLNDSVVKPLNEVSDTLSTISDTVKLIKTETETLESNTSKIKELHKTSKDIFDEIEGLSKNITEISKVNETLQELLRTMSHQEEFYQTTLNQYKNMTTKDVELIENLARKLK